MRKWQIRLQVQNELAKTRLYTKLLNLICNLTLTWLNLTVTILYLVLGTEIDSSM